MKPTYKAVTGTFVVPAPKAPSGGSGTYSASAWVGIDGYTCGTAILQVGVVFTISGSSVSFDGWYEWYPDYAYDFSGITFSAGDTVKFRVTATSTNAGTAVIENVTTGKTVIKSLTSSSTLCEESAEWIVEDCEEGSSYVPFANFGNTTWTDACATSLDGICVGPGSGTFIGIEQGSGVLATASATTTSATCSYV